MKFFYLFSFFAAVILLSSKQIQSKKTSKAVKIEQILYSGNTKLDEQIAKKLFLEYRNENQFSYQFEIFYQNLQKIVDHNLNKEKTWKMGINQFAFISDLEFNQNYLGASGQNCSATAYHTLNTKIFNNKNKQNYNDDTDLPLYVNWKEQDKVSPVKDQRNCGSCWAFSAIGAMESQQAIKYNIYPPFFSEQQLVDCAQDFDNNGCSGGLPSHAFEYIKYNGGLQFENSYPYSALDGNGCFYQPQQKGAFALQGSYNITYQDEVELQEKVATVGPVSVAYTVDSDFKLYESGIYNNPNCPSSSEDVNHAVLAVGYGTEDGTDYWYLKNSWSEFWGDHGYFKMVRGQNMCGVSNCASYPILE